MKYFGSTKFLFNIKSFLLLASEWDELNRFAIQAGFTIVFDLNCLIRNGDGSWNSKNAQKIIEYSNGAGYNLHWQLGNGKSKMKIIVHKYIQS